MFHISDLLPKFDTYPRLDKPATYPRRPVPGTSLAIKEFLTQLRTRGIPAIAYDPGCLLSRDVFHVATDVILDVDPTVEQFQRIECFLASGAPGFLFIRHACFDSHNVADEAVELQRSASRLVDRAIEAVLTSASRERPVALVIDELPMLGRLHNLPAAMFARKSGVVWAVPVQAWQQVEERYGAGVAHRMRSSLRFAALDNL